MEGMSVRAGNDRTTGTGRGDFTPLLANLYLHGWINVG